MNVRRLLARYVHVFILGYLPAKEKDKALGLIFKERG